MKNNVLIVSLLAAAAVSAPALARAQAAPQADAQPAGAAEVPDSTGAEAAPAKPVTEVMSRGSDGVADVVSIDGQSYKVCKGEVQDSCVNPRTAGLKFGSRDLQYWPGRPASEISTPLPASPPANLPIEDPVTAPG